MCGSIENLDELGYNNLLQEKFLGGIEKCKFYEHGYHRQIPIYGDSFLSNPSVVPLGSSVCL